MMCTTDQIAVVHQHVIDMITMAVFLAVISREDYLVSCTEQEESGRPHGSQVCSPFCLSQPFQIVKPWSQQKDIR